MHRSLTTDGRRISGRIRITATGICPAQRRGSKPARCAPRYARGTDAAWREKDDKYTTLVTDTGRRCGFDVLNIQTVPGLDQSNYADEMHVNASGIPIYTRYLVAQLRP
jgi:hypothetical protein